MIILTTPQFHKEAKALLKKHPSLPNDLELFFESLQNKPVQGIPLGNDCYKIRLAIKSKGKGKSGGARVITYVKIEANKILLISIYDKSVKASVSDRELRNLIENIPDNLK